MHMLPSFPNNTHRKKDTHFPFPCLVPTVSAVSVKGENGQMMWQVRRSGITVITLDIGCKIRGNRVTDQVQHAVPICRSASCFM